MPELPEVETLVSELNEILVLQKISAVEIREDSILETPREWFETGLPEKEILQVGRRGKFIRVVLSEGLTLWFHLGMTGQLLFDPADSPESHVHLVLSFAGGKKLFFRDPRRFGKIALTPWQGKAFPGGVGRLGPEPEEWQREEFISFLKQRKGRIKNLLMNQSLIAGLGNIYTDEVLHRAGIRPLKRASSVSSKSLGRLHQAIGEVLEEAVRWGGSSIDDYLHLDGARGGFQAFHRVYGRAGRSCGSCGALIRRVKLSGRSSFFCPRCQK